MLFLRHPSGADTFRLVARTPSSSSLLSSSLRSKEESSCVSFVMSVPVVVEVEVEVVVVGAQTTGQASSQEAEVKGGHSCWASRRRRLFRAPRAT